MPESPDINEELLSAYFDNELSPEQRNKMSAALSADPQLRQTLEDFDFLHEELQALPVVFHHDQELLLTDVITKIREANLSVQATPVHRKQPLPSPGRTWQQRVRFPVLLTLTAAILAMITMPYLNESDNTTVVQTDAPSRAVPADEPSKRRRQTDRQSAEELGDAGKEGAMAGSAPPTADVEALASTLGRDDHRNELLQDDAAGANAPRPASPNKHQELENKTSVPPSKMQPVPLAPVAYQIQVEQQHLDALIELLAMDPARHLADNPHPSGTPGGLGGGSALRTQGEAEGSNLAADAKRNKSNGPQTKALALDQVFVVQGSTQQVTKLLSIISDHPAFTLSQQVVQSNLLKQTPLRKSPNPNQDIRLFDETQKDKNVNVAGTIFTIRIIPPAVPADPPK